MASAGPEFVESAAVGLAVRGREAGRHVRIGGHTVLLTKWKVGSGVRVNGKPQIPGNVTLCGTVFCKSEIL